MKKLTAVLAVLLLGAMLLQLSGCAALFPALTETVETPSPIVTTTPDLEREKAEAEKAQREKELEAQLSAERNAIIEESRELFAGYFYDEAISLLTSDERLINQETESLKKEFLQAKDSLILFEGEVKHIFFHSLILYPEYLFPDLTVPTGGYNEGFAFKSELERLLPQLLERGYVLYNINDVFAKNENGEMVRKEIYLPEGKKPLVLSVDDPSYHYGIGFAHRMILDENGELATQVVTPENELIVTYDGDVELVINSFVAEHPEFSYRGHKGIIASTGYMGIFGYDLESEESKVQATAVCDKMKSEGWLFASHSYTHNGEGYWGVNSNPEKIRYDTNKWRATIEPITGATNLFIAPFGWTLSGDGLEVILSNGYDIYCSVNPRQQSTVFPRYALMERLEIGGYSLVRYTDILNRDFFDVSTVKDSHRPPISN